MLHMKCVILMKSITNTIYESSENSYMYVCVHIYIYNFTMKREFNGSMLTPKQLGKLTTPNSNSFYTLKSK